VSSVETSNLIQQMRATNISVGLLTLGHTVTWFYSVYKATKMN